MVRPVQPDVILRLFCAEERVRHIEHQVNIVKTALRAQFLRVVQRFNKVGVRGCRLDQKADAEPLCVLPMAVSDSSAQRHASSLRVP